MARDVAELLRDATQLPEADRAELAGRLLETLHGEPDEGVKAAWAKEVERRVRQIDSFESKASRGRKLERSSTLACMAAVTFHPAADEELVDATDWYLARSGTAALVFVREIEHALARIGEAPERYLLTRLVVAGSSY